VWACAAAHDLYHSACARQLSAIKWTCARAGGLSGALAEGLEGGERMGDFLRFETMITPLVIQAIFWIVVVILIIVGIVQMVASGGGIGIATGLATIILGPLLARIYCEIVIVLFRINDHLRAIQHNTQRG